MTTTRGARHTALWCMLAAAAVTSAASAATAQSSPGVAPDCGLWTVQDAAGILSDDQHAAIHAAACSTFAATGAQVMLAVRWGSPAGPAAEAEAHYQHWIESAGDAHNRLGVLLYVDAAAHDATGVVVFADPALSGVITANVRAAVLDELDRGRSLGAAQGDDHDAATARGVTRAYGYLAGTVESRYGPNGFPAPPTSADLAGGRVAVAVTGWLAAMLLVAWVATKPSP